MVRCDVATPNKLFVMDMTDLEFSELYVGEHHNPNTRQELQGLPVLRGFRGPMYNGTDSNGNAKFRYETDEILDVIP